jgi:hypothetical protein
MDIEKLKALALEAEEGGDIFVMMDKLQAFQCEADPAAVLELIAEVERLRADADRYRWLREKSIGQWEHPIVVEQMRAMDRMQYIGPLSFGALDKAIDAALEKEKA